MPQDKNQITLVFVINGENFPVSTNVEATLINAVEKALKDSGNVGRRDPNEWEVRDANGVLLDLHKKVRDLGLTDGTRLFLSLRVGAGGCN